MVIIFLISLDWQRNVHWLAYAIVIFVFLVIQMYGTLYMSSNFFLRAICNGKKETNSIALTFDDGPGESTLKALEILKAHGVKGCFFCIGKNIEENPALLKQLHAEGHIIGNHSYQHRWNFDLMSSSKMRAELTRTDAAIESVIHVRPRFFRPPYGVTNPMLAAAVADYQSIGWSIRSFDTVIKDPKRLLKRVTRKLKGGDIVLFHDHSDTMLQILPDFIKHVQSIGLKIVRLDQLIKETPYIEKS